MWHDTVLSDWPAAQAQTHGKNVPPPSSLKVSSPYQRCWTSPRPPRAYIHSRPPNHPDPNRQIQSAHQSACGKLSFHQILHCLLDLPTPFTDQPACQAVATRIHPIGHRFPLVQVIYNRPRIIDIPSLPKGKTIMPLLLLPVSVITHTLPAPSKLPAV